MQVSLNSRSWHAKYYKFVKGYYPTYEFKSLCPYFWTIVSFILLLPVILVWKLIKHLTVKPIKRAIKRGFDKALSEPYEKKVPNKFFVWWEKNDDKIGEWFGRIYFGFLGLITVVVIIGAIIQLFKEKGTWLGFIYIFAWIGALATLIFLIWGIISFFETDVWRMIKGMGYSAKNKVCPMIKWDGKSVNYEEDLDEFEVY